MGLLQLLPSRPAAQTGTRGSCLLSLPGILLPVCFPFFFQVKRPREGERIPQPSLLTQLRHSQPALLAPAQPGEAALPAQPQPHQETSGQAAAFMASPEEQTF